MQVKREVIRDDRNVSVTRATEYAFSTRHEAELAEGVISAMLERLLQTEDDLYLPHQTAAQTRVTNRGAAEELRGAVKLRQLGLELRSAPDDVGDFLSQEQSIHLRNAVGWAMGYRDKQLHGQAETSDLPAAINSAFLLQDAVFSLEFQATEAAKSLLDANDVTGWRKVLLRAPTLPNLVIAHDVSTLDGTPVATVVTADQLVG